MKVLSFDVGIKNLAYCILEDTKILYWEVITVPYDIKDEICKKCYGEPSTRGTFFRAAIEQFRG